MTADERARLLAFASALDAEGFANELVAATEQVPYDVLLVALTDDDGRDAWQLELSFVPGMEEQLEGVALLQCFTAVAELAPAAVAEAGHAAVVLNRTLPIVGFGVLDEPAVAMFRHTMLLPHDLAASTPLVVQVTWLISYLLSLFAGPVTAVAAGRATLRSALQEHPHRDLLLGS